MLKGVKDRGQVVFEGGNESGIQCYFMSGRHATQIAQGPRFWSPLIFVRLRGQGQSASGYIFDLLNKKLQSPYYGPELS